MRDPEAKRDLVFLEKQITLPMPGGKNRAGEKTFPPQPVASFAFRLLGREEGICEVTGTPDSSFFSWKCTALVASFWRVGLGRPDMSPWLEGRGQRR